MKTRGQGHRYYFPVASILGIAFILLLNLSVKNLAISGLKLPFSWDGPHYWFTESLHDHSSGLPFTMIKYSAIEGAYYTSTLTLGLNIASGIGLGLGGNAIIRKIKKQ